jgi:hypothetical protein
MGSKGEAKTKHRPAISIEFWDILYGDTEETGNEAAVGQNRAVIPFANDNLMIRKSRCQDDTDKDEFLLEQ